MDHLTAQDFVAIWRHAQRPTWLDNAHWRLDEAVFAAYGWPADLSDDEILARLLRLNLERAAGQGQAEAEAASGKDEGDEG